MEAGVDEAGRGALAGPVVAAAVILKPKAPIKYFQDSKSLTEKQRIEAYNIILESSVCWKISSVSHKYVDRVNIFQATMKTMTDAISRLNPIPEIAYIDGNKIPKTLTIKAKAIVGGDKKVACISAASILAKVTRDEIMKRADQKYPDYHFSAHKGYGTKQHYDAIFEIGPSPIHRLSFNLNRQETLF